ncbi:MAG: hypothetical protein JSS02_34785 [Planctomycetes bacterium]|nr:hypothetical protein [Planctomycetota bacterium]
MPALTAVVISLEYAEWQDSCLQQSTRWKVEQLQTVLTGYDAAGSASRKQFESKDSGYEADWAVGE